jgi:hypothetical protein
MDDKDYMYVELSFTFPAELAASILAAEVLGQYDPSVTLFSDEGGIVAAVSLAADDNPTMGEVVDEAIDIAADVLFERTPEETVIPNPWSTKLVDRELMAQYFQQVVRNPVMPACGPVDDDGLEGAGV